MGFPHLFVLCAWSLGSESLPPFIGLGLMVSNVEVIFPLSLCLQFYLSTTRWRVNTYLALKKKKKKLYYFQVYNHSDPIFLYNIK